MRPIKITAAILAILVAAGAVAYFALRHRISDKSLGYSVASAAETPFTSRCTPRGRLWRCGVTDGSGGVDYLVEVDGHCWRARKTGVDGSETPFPRRLTGCIGIHDQIRLLDRL